MHKLSMLSVISHIELTKDTLIENNMKRIYIEYFLLRKENAFEWAVSIYVPRQWNQSMVLYTV